MGNLPFHKFTIHHPCVPGRSLVLVLRVYDVAAVVLIAGEQLHISVKQKQYWPSSKDFALVNAAKKYKIVLLNHNPLLIVQLWASYNPDEKLW